MAKRRMLDHNYQIKVYKRTIRNDGQGMQIRLTRAGVLGDTLGTFRDGVLAQFTGEDQSGGSLDLSGRNGGSLVVSSQLGSFRSKTFEDILDE